MPDVAPQVPPRPSVPSTEPEIHIIPDAYYGAALKAHVSDHVPKAPQTGAPTGIEKPPKSKTPLIVALSTIVVLGIAGVFVYVNRNVFFPPPAPAPVVVETPPPPPPVTPPSAPTNLIATSTNSQSVAISWADTATDESGFRIERSTDGQSYQSLTNLPPNSASFLDVSVQPGTTYRYRVVASNQGGDSSPSSESFVSVAALPPPAPEAPKLPPAGLDSDSDGLSDLEEGLFATNAQLPDTDGDGFLDGNEVFHLYNPNGLAPATLLDAKVVKNVSGSVGWNMQIPTSWTFVENSDGSSATISSGHGEKFVVTIADNAKKQPIVDWYLAAHPQVTASQVLQYRSKRGYLGIIGADLLTTYIPWGDKVFVFTYDLGGQTFINFRTTYSMMLNSLMLQGVPQIAPPVAGAPLPFEPAATSTGVIAQPVPLAGVEAMSTPSATSTP